MHVICFDTFTYQYIILCYGSPLLSLYYRPCIVYEIRLRFILLNMQNMRLIGIKSMTLPMILLAALTDLLDISHRRVEEVRSDREAGSHDEYNEERHQAEPDMLLLQAAVVVAVVLRRHLGQLQHAPIIAHTEHSAFMAVSWRMTLHVVNSKAELPITCIYDNLKPYIWTPP